MKRLLLMLILVVFSAQPAFAARAKVNSIAKDPYLSALVLDADTGKIIFSDHPDTVVYPASVLKLMNLLIILEHVEQGKLKLSDMVQVTKEAAKTGGSQVYLDPKEQFPVEDLVYALAVQSANDAAVALATHIAGSKDGFVALMNRKAEELGMKSTRFHTVHGLPPAEGQKPDETTATDLALLCRELAKRPAALKYTGTKEHGFRDQKFMMRNHNHLLGEVDGCDGFKTGYFEAAGFSIATTAKRGGVRIIAIVMGSKDRKVRDAKAKELLAKGFVAIPPKMDAAPAVGKTGSSGKKTEPTATAAATAAGQEPKTQLPEPVEKIKGSSLFDSGWVMFAIGMIAGMTLLAAALYLIPRKRPKKDL